MRKFLCIGHRGAAGLEPENTLRSVRRALDIGVDGIEIDVYFTGGELVVIHDETLERTTNGRGHVEDQSLDYLRSLDAGGGEKIPFLHEVLDTVDRRAFVNIELKGACTAQPVRYLIEEYVRDHGWRVEDFIVSSFDHAELSRIAGCGLRLGPLFSKLPRGYINVARSMEAWSIHLGSRVLDAAVAADIHAAGFKLFVYTINDAAEINLMRSIGADGIFTDYPDRVLPPA